MGHSCPCNHLHPFLATKNLKSNAFSGQRSAIKRETARGSTGEQNERGNIHTRWAYYTHLVTTLCLTISILTAERTAGATALAKEYIFEVFCCVFLWCRKLKNKKQNVRWARENQSPTSCAGGGRFNLRARANGEGARNRHPSNEKFGFSFNDRGPTDAENTGSVPVVKRRRAAVAV